MTIHGIVGTDEGERIPPDDASESDAVYTTDGAGDGPADDTADEELLVSCRPSAELRTYSPKAFLVLALRNSETALREGAADLLYGDAEDDLEDLASDLDAISDNIRVYLWNIHKAGNTGKEEDSDTNGELCPGETGT